MTTVLVTGGCGFIGSHACVCLLEQNYNIVVLDSNINSSPNSLIGVKNIFKNKGKSSIKIKFVKGDIRDEKVLKNIFSEAENCKNQIEAVIHFAGLKSVEESVFNPLSYWDNNVYGTLQLIKVMNLYNCKTIVFSSSATVYKNNDSGLLKETDDIKPSNPYGFTKATVESVLKTVFESDDEWRIANLRYFNPIGAHQSGFLGENPKNKPNNLFPFICGVASGKFNELRIFGNNWPTFDGTGIRDYIHVMDLAEAHICSIDFLLKEKPQILNLNVGTGIGTSVIELVNTFQNVNKIDIPFKFSEKREGDVAMIVADNSKIISLLDWNPKRNLKDMCFDGWNWQSKNQVD